MRARPSSPRLVRAAAALGALAFGLALALATCGRPPDEAWLRVTSIADSDGKVASSVTSVLETTTTTVSSTTSTTSSGTSSESSVETTTETSTGTPDYITVTLANQSVIVGTSATAGGVTVERVHISYQAAGYALPAADFAATVYVPASGASSTSTSGSSTTGGGTATLQIPLVSSELKSWLVANVPRSTRERGLTASARIVFHATSFEGGAIETDAGIGIEFVNKTTSTETTTETSSSQ